MATTVTSELPVRDQNRRTERWLHSTGTAFWNITSAPQ